MYRVDLEDRVQEDKAVVTGGNGVLYPPGTSGITPCQTCTGSAKGTTMSASR